MSDGHGYRVQLFADPLLETPEGKCHLSPYQRALLILVYAHESISRPSLAALLWGEDEPEGKTRQRLRQLKSEIRKRANTHVLETKGDRLAANPAIASDFRSVAADLDQGSLTSAARTVARGLGCPEIRDISTALDRWSEDFCSRLRSRIAAQASAQWQATSDGTDWPAARDAAEALYVLRPDDAEITARVIEARARVGQVQAAEVAYAEFCEVGSPSDASSLVDEAISRVRVLSEVPRSPRFDTRVPFVGRKRALADLTTIFDDVRSGVFSFALVAGEAGIGKTRLIREVERSARLEGFRCLAAEPVELERRIPMNPVIDALSSIDLEPHLEAIGEPWRTVIGTMLPPGPLAESVQALPPIEEKSLSRRLLDAFSLLFRSIADERPTIFFLDDLQWADATTIAALQFYQRRWRESYFGVVATVRSGAVRKKDAAHAYLEDDGKLGVRRVDLEELSEKEALKLVELLGEGRMEPSDVAKLCALSGRHPLYLTELTRDFLSGRLTLPSSEADAFTIPISLKQILSSRTDGLDESGRAVLNVLTVGSKPMRIGDLAEILDHSLDRTADAAGELSERQLIEVDRDRVWIAHELFRTAIYRELSEAHRAVVHHRLAEHIRTHRGEEAAGELAIHLDRAGRPQISAKYGWTAGGRAFERGAVAEAAHFFELVTRNEPDEPRRAEATAMLATSLHLNRDMSRANPALELASSRLRGAGMTERARRMEIRRVEGLAEVGDTPVDELVERLGGIKDESREAGDWEGVALALDTELQLLQLAERLEDVRCLYREFRSVLEKGNQPAVAIAHQGLAVGLMLEDADAALGSARIAVAGLRDQDGDLLLKSLNRLVIVLLHKGILHSDPAHRDLLAEANRLADRSGDLLQRFSLESNLGVSYLDAGNLDLAELHFDRAGAMLGDADMTFPRINLAINRGELAVAHRDFSQAAHHFSSAGEHAGLAIPKYTKRMVTAGLGLCALETGKVAEARRLFESLPPAPSSWPYDPTPLLHFQVRYLELRGDVEGAIQVLETAQRDLEGRLVAAWVKTQLALARLFRKAGDSRMTEAAMKGVEVTDTLSMSTRAREFRLLLT